MRAWAEMRSVAWPSATHLEVSSTNGCQDSGGVVASAVEEVVSEIVPRTCSASARKVGQNPPHVISPGVPSIMCFPRHHRGRELARPSRPGTMRAGRIGAICGHQVNRPATAHRWRRSEEPLRRRARHAQPASTLREAIKEPARAF